MRRREFEGSREDGVALLQRSEVMHLAGVGADGRPVLKTLHGVVDGDALCFHAAPAGEKTSLVGREVVVGVEAVVARIPSFFSDPERACPATTCSRPRRCGACCARSMIPSARRGCCSA